MKRSTKRAYQDWASEMFLRSNIISPNYKNDPTIFYWDMPTTLWGKIKWDLTVWWIEFKSKFIKDNSLKLDKDGLPILTLKPQYRKKYEEK